MQVVWTQGPSALFSAQVQRLNLVLEHGACAQILALVLLKKVCSHCYPNLESYLGTKCDLTFTYPLHALLRMRQQEEPSVNTAFVSLTVSVTCLSVNF